VQSPSHDDECDGSMTVGDIQLIDMGAGRGSTVHKFEGHDTPVVSLQFADEGRLLVYAHASGVVGTHDLRTSRFQPLCYLMLSLFSAHSAFCTMPRIRNTRCNGLKAFLH
jgi:hypothetical protein